MYILISIFPDLSQSIKLYTPFSISEEVGQSSNSLFTLFAKCSVASLTVKFPLALLMISTVWRSIFKPTKIRILSISAMAEYNLKKPLVRKYPTMMSKNCVLSFNILLNREYKSFSGSLVKNFIS